MTTYNRSKIMKAAWTEYRRVNSNGFLHIRKGKVIPLSTCLAKAWADAKKRAAAHAAWEASQASKSELDKVNDRIFSLEMKDRWTDADFALSRKLHAEKLRLQAS